jgi:hypothetical protein
MLKDSPNFSLTLSPPLTWAGKPPYSCRASQMQQFGRVLATAEDRPSIGGQARAVHIVGPTVQLPYRPRGTPGSGPRDGSQQLGAMRPRTERVADGTVVLRRITHPVRGRSRMLASKTATREAGA